MIDVSESAGLHRLSMRNDAERLLELAEHLAPSDRALLRSIYRHGMSAAELARAMGIRPRRVTDRVQKLMQRINSPHFRSVLAQRERWPAIRRRIAEAVFLRGEGQRTVAAKLQCTVHEVRIEIERIRAIIEAPLPMLPTRAC